MTSTRDRLKDETRSIHERLHDHASFKTLLNRDITQAGYAALLSRLLGYHLGLETAFEGYAIRDANLKKLAGPRSDSLLDDLATMGQIGSQIDQTQIMPSPNFINCDAALLGCLYVREGAMIGGRSLARTLDPLCTSTNIGRTFFQGKSGDTQIWKLLCIALNQVEKRSDQDQIVAAALGTFALFENWMDGMEPNALKSVTR
jgi:heme oxygenase (biliverdin-IX-beta and delta-forming)